MKKQFETEIVLDAESVLKIVRMIQRPAQPTQTLRRLFVRKSTSKRCK